RHVPGAPEPAPGDRGRPGGRTPTTIYVGRPAAVVGPPVDPGTRPGVPAIAGEDLGTRDQPVGDDRRVGGGPPGDERGPDQEVVPDRRRVPGNLLQLLPHRRGRGRPEIGPPRLAAVGGRLPEQGGRAVHADLG